MAMLGLLRFSADGKHVEVQYYSPYHGGTYHPSNRDMLTLTLDITGQATEQIQYPQPQTPDEPPIDDTPDAPIDAPDKPDKADDPSTVGGLVVILIAAAVIVVGAGVTVPLILMKKKKK